MIKKALSIGLIMIMVWGSTALADPSPEPETTQQASSTQVPAPTPTPQPNEIFDRDNAIILKEGSSCDEVIMLQSRLRDLGYFNYKITNYYGSKTKDAVESFQRNNGLHPDGIAGAQTYNVLFNNSAKRAPITEVVKPTPTPKPVQNTASNNTGAKVSSVPKGQLKDWFNWVSARFTRGSKVLVIDVATGTQFNVTMVGGSNHADVEPCTKTDTAALKKIYGGSWSWDRRAVVVKISGIWVAGSINGMPHGYETVAGNDMTGQVCIHFLNSKTHVKDLPDSDHQRMVKKAAGQ